MSDFLSTCYCGSNVAFDQCCGPILAGTPAKTPEALMRSRYSAYVLGNMDHIDRTFAPEVKNDFDRAEAERTASEIEWLGLEVVNSSENGDKGTVEFSLRFRRRDLDGQELTQHEVSNFRRSDGHWLYVDGKVTANVAPRHVVKVGRNDPCPCGSGKKFKKCCDK